MSYRNDVICRISCLSFDENLRQLQQYSVRYSMYLDLKIDSILMTTDSTKVECTPHSQRLASVFELMAGVKVT